MKRMLPCLLAVLMVLPSFGVMAQTDSQLEWDTTTFATLFPYAEQMQERAKDAVVLRTGVNCALVRGEQTVVDEQIKVTPEEQNGTVFVPVAFTAMSLGAEVSAQSAETVAFRADGKDVTLTAGSASMQVASTGQQLSAAPYAKEGVLLAPVTELAALFGKKVTVTTEREIGGLIIISDTDTFFQEGEEDLAWELICQMSYARPSGKQVLADMEAHQNGAHPRIMATAADFARIRRDVKTDPHMKQWFEDTKATADELIAKDLGEPPEISDFGKGNDMRDDITTIAMVYQITQDEKYAEYVRQYLLYACDIPKWGPAQFLDVVETSSGVCIGYDWIYNYLTPEERQKISSTIVTKALQPGLNTYRPDEPGAWPTRDTNWNVVCNGGMLMGAIAVADEDPATAEEIIEYSMRGVEYMMKQYATSGGWHEGVTYWDYTDEFLVYMISTLMSATGTDYGLYYNTQGMRHTGYYLFDMIGPGGIFNIHDADEKATMEAERMFFHADHMDDNVLAKMTLQNKEGVKGDALDLLFYKPEKMKNCESESLPPLDGYYNGVEIAAMRSDWQEPNAVYAALHGGWNQDIHGQVDAGDFVLDALGQRWICDTGKENYNLPGFWNYTQGGGRGTYYCNRAEGNNTLVINPNSLEGQVVDATATMIATESKARGAYSVLDMTEVLQPYVSSAKRGMMLYDDRSKVLLQDELQLKGEYNVLWFAHTKADITLSADRKTAYLEQNGRRMQVSILDGAPSGAVFRVMKAEPLSVSPNPSGQKSLSSIQKLVISFKAKGSVTLPVVFIPLEGGDAPQLPEVTKISNWTIPDGNLAKQTYPSIDGITINGEPLESFNKSTVNYSVDLDQYDDEEVIVEATAAAGIQTEVEEIGRGKYRITATNRRGKQNLYEISCTFQARPVPDGVERSEVKKLSVSSQPQPENAAENAIDGDLNTRWSAEGTDEWIQLELNQEETLDGVGIAFMSGDERTADIEVQLSKDGVTWETIFSGDTSGRTEQEEYFTAGGKAARFVRVLCHGTSAGIWNSILEIGAYRAK